jgi:hypothetical protein
MMVMPRAVDRLLNEVIPAAADYDKAEKALSEASAADPSPSSWEPAARETRRRAAQLAVAIEGLTERAAIDLNVDPKEIRKAVTKLCRWPTPSGAPRPEAIERIRAVAAAYRHHNWTIQTCRFEQKMRLWPWAPVIGSRLKSSPRGRAKLSLRSWQRLTGRRVSLSAMSSN